MRLYVSMSDKADSAVTERSNCSSLAPKSTQPQGSSGGCYEKLSRVLLENLTPRIIMLLLYFAWYLWIVINFRLPQDISYVKWGTSILLSIFVGTALNVNAYVPPFEEHLALRRWAIFRFYLIPFCVSSYSNVSFYYNFVALFPVHDYVTGVIGIAVVILLGLILSLANYSLSILCVTNSDVDIEIPKQTAHTTDITVISEPSHC